MFSVRGSNGVVKINGDIRGSGKALEDFKKISCYIQQEDVVRPLLRVSEALIMAIHLKLGCNLSSQQKRDKVSNV